MNEKLQEALTTLLNGIIDASKRVGEVTNEQLPLVVQEYLQWGLYRSIAVLCIFTILFFILLYVCRNIKNHEGISCVRDGCRDQHCEHMKCTYLVGGILLPSFFGLIWTFIACFHLLNIIQITVAPRVYLIEQIKYFMK